MKLKKILISSLKILLSQFFNEDVIMRNLLENPLKCIYFIFNRVLKIFQLLARTFLLKYNSRENHDHFRAKFT